MDVQHISLIGYATCGQMLNADGFKVFEIGGIFEKMSKSKLEKDIFQLPKGLEIKPNSEIFGITRSLSESKKHYCWFFVHYKYAGMEQITGGRPCFYAGVIGYALENKNQPFFHPDIEQLLKFLDLVTENARQRVLYPNKETENIALPKFFNAQKQGYEYELSDAKKHDYFYLPNIEKQKFDFVELAYSNKLEIYKRIFGISSQEIINDIKDKPISDLSLAFPQAEKNYPKTEQETSFLKNEPVPQIDTTEIEKKNQSQTYLQIENINLKREIESLQEFKKYAQFITDTIERNTDIIERNTDIINQNTIIFQTYKEQSGKIRKNKVDLRWILGLLWVGFIFLFVAVLVYRPTPPFNSQVNQKDLRDSLFNGIEMQTHIIDSLERELLKVKLPKQAIIYHPAKIGDNLEDIANLYHVSIDSLFYNNPNDTNRGLLRVKKKTNLLIKKGN